MCSYASWNAAAPQIWHLTLSPAKVHNIEESQSVCRQKSIGEDLEGWREALLCFCTQVFQGCDFEEGICVGSKSHEGLIKGKRKKKFM